jgi:hypothetical protein
VEGLPVQEEIETADVVVVGDNHPGGSGRTAGAVLGRRAGSPS